MTEKEAIDWFEQFRDNLVFEDNEYVGWYYAGETE